MSAKPVKLKRNLVSPLTTLYCVLNIITLSAFTFFTYHSCYFVHIPNWTLQGDHLTWFGIITALWISGLTIIVFILGKTNEIIYGIKFSNIIIWRVSTCQVICTGFVYTLLLPWGFWACFWGADMCIAVDLFLIYICLVGTGFLVIYYSKKTNVFNAIRCNTIERVCEMCHTPTDLDTDYLGKINQLPLIKMIRYMEHDDSEETQRVKNCLRDICRIFNKENVVYRYFILMPIISTYCNKAGFNKRYEAANTTDFFIDLLRQPRDEEYPLWDEECQLWIRAGILLPIVEKWRGSDIEIDLVHILNHIPWSDRQKLLVIILLYIEYLYCCGNVEEKCFDVLQKTDFSRIIQSFVIDEYEKHILFQFWISWGLLDHQEDFLIDVFNNFISDWREWKNEGYVCRTWVLKRLMWEEWMS